MSLDHLPKDYLEAQADTFTTDESSGDQVAREQIRALLPPPSHPNSWLLMVGCKTGAEILESREMGWRNIIGVDLFPEQAISNGCCCVKADMAHIPFAGQTFDVIYSRDALEHSNDLVGSLYEFHRLLKPNGKLVLSVPIMKFEDYHEVVLDYSQWQDFIRLFFLPEYERQDSTQYVTLSHPLNYFYESGNLKEAEWLR